MRSEIVFILFLIAPWVLVLIALFFYRQRRMNKPLDGSGCSRNDGDGRV
jgi:purine-cytosine permease-like protein